MASIKTSLQKISIKSFFSKSAGGNSRGFTLIEVMIVIAIIAAIFAIGLPLFRKPEKNIKDVARELKVLSREIRHYARIKSSTYRLAFKMGPEGSFWVEASSGQALILSEENEKKLKELNEKDRPSSGFQRVDRPLKKEKALPAGVSFTKFETTYRQDPITSGIAYIHFSPEGLVEQSAIQISTDKNVTWTLLFNPLTGQADIVDKAMSLKDAQTQ